MLFIVKHYYRALLLFKAALLLGVLSGCDGPATEIIPQPDPNDRQPILSKCLNDFRDVDLRPTRLKFGTLPLVEPSSPLPEGKLLIQYALRSDRRRSSDVARMYLNDIEIRIRDLKTGANLRWYSGTQPYWESLAKFGSCFVFYALTEPNLNGHNGPEYPGVPVVVDLRVGQGETIQSTIGFPLSPQWKVSDYIFKDGAKLYFLASLTSLATFEEYYGFSISGGGMEEVHPSELVVRPYDFYRSWLPVQSAACAGVNYLGMPREFPSRYMDIQQIYIEGGAIKATPITTSGTEIIGCHNDALLFANDNISGVKSYSPREGVRTFCTATDRKAHKECIRVSRNLSEPRGSDSEFPTQPSDDP